MIFVWFSMKTEEFITIATLRHETLQQMKHNVSATAASNAPNAIPA